MTTSAGDRVLDGQPAPHALARAVDRARRRWSSRGARSRPTRTRSGAAAAAPNGRTLRRPVLVDDDHLARLDVAHELGPEQLERAGLRRRRPRSSLALPSDQRPEPHRIAHRDQRVLGQEDQRVGAAHLAKRVGGALGQRPLARARDEVDDDLGVGGGLEDRAFRLEPLAQLDRVDEVAVVADRDRAARVVDRDRLGVLLDRVARGRVAHVADRRVTRAGPPGGRP